MELNDAITLIITNTATYIEGRVSSELYSKIKDELSYTPEDAAFRIKQIKKTRKYNWDGKVYLIHRNAKYCKCPIKKDGTHFPTGLFGKVRKVLQDNNISYKVIDRREKPDKNLILEMSNEVEMRHYQEDAAESSAKQTRAILQSATGSGKNCIGARIIQKAGVSPFIFYVPSIDLLKQSQAELSRFLLKDGINIKIGAIGGGVYDPADITVMTIQTAVRACGQEYVKFDEEDKETENEDLLIAKRKEILDLITSAKGYIADEVQHWAAESCQIISDYSAGAYYRIGLSATPFRDKNDDMLIEACFGKISSNISASFLIKKGFLVKPYIYFVSHEPKNIEGETYASIYKEAIVENDERNKIIAKMATTMADNGSNVLVLVQQIAHGKILKELMPESKFLHGSSTGKERHSHLEEMRGEKSRITVASVIFDEGIDVRSLDTLILAGGGKSKTRALQRIGRTLRPYTNPITGEKKEFATIIDFEDHCKYLLQHSRKRKSIYKTEEEFVIDYLKV